VFATRADLLNRFNVWILESGDLKGKDTPKQKETVETVGESHGREHLDFIEVLARPKGATVKGVKVPFGHTLSGP